jgi:hypothetical protein
VEAAKIIAKYIHQHAGLASQPFEVFSPIGLTEEQCNTVLLGQEFISATGIQRETGLLVQIGKGTLVIEHFERLPVHILEQLVQVHIFIWILQQMDGTVLIYYPEVHLDGLWADMAQHRLQLLEE